MTMSRALKFCLPLLVLAFSPAVAYADAGTPLMWAGLFHLLIGNAIIGVGEGLILSRLFRPKRRVRSHHDRRKLFLGLGRRRISKLCNRRQVGT